MNHLAHLLLSGPDPALRAGGFLGDFVRGRLGGRFPERVEAGIRLHRFVDVYTDAHPVVREMVDLFPPQQRRWAPVALDVWFDHLLARDFEVHAGEALAPFARRACADLERHAPLMDDAARGFLARLVEAALLERYAARETVTGVLRRLARRSHRTGSLQALDASLDTLAEPIAARFPALLEDLLETGAAWRAEHGLP
ncbi:MAG: ACP phosphodiesterase [Pseudomonadales bacterium]|nr:ACP phosphodiesterase [Pseudomonadales bacterium]